MFTAGIVADTLKGGFYWILLSLDGFVHTAITKLYKVYVLLAGARILTNDAFTTIANQLYIIIGVTMLFVLAYSIIRAIINPDEMTKGNYSGPKIIKGVITCVIGLAIAPVLFNLAYQGQDIILKQNVIGKMFFASDINDKYDYNIELPDGSSQSGTVDSSQALDQAGNIVAIYIWQTFFYPSELNAVDETKIVGETAEYLISPGATAALGIGCAIGVAAGIAAAIFTLGFGALAAVATAAACTGALAGAATGAMAEAFAEEMTLAQAISLATTEGDFGIFQIFTENIIDGEITYFFGVSTIVGLFVCYTFLSFSIDMAVRAAKLAYYQIIAPVPLIMQVIPEFKENFSKWLKDIIHTFLEVLIRLSVIYVVVYIIAHLNVLTTSSAQLWANEDVSMSMGFFARLLLILGLVIFAKMAPKLISQTFKIDSADMKLGIGKKLAEGGAFTAAATIGAAATGMVRNFNAEHKKELPDGMKNSLRARGGRMIKSIGSGLTGGLSAGTRVAGGRAWDMAHGKKDPVNPHMAMEAARNATRRTTEGKQRRDKYREEHGGTDGGVIMGRINDARDAISLWATGPVDTSYQDGQAKLLADLAGLKSLLEGKINPTDEQYSAAVRAVQDAEKLDVGDLAYKYAVDRKAIEKLVSDLHGTHGAAMQTMLAQKSGESVADYQKRVADFMEKRDEDLTAAQKTARDAFKATVGASWDMASARAYAKSSGGVPASKSEFVLDPDSHEYKMAQEHLNRARHDADEALKKAKKDAVARSLVQASTGSENDVSRALTEFFSTRQKDIRTYGRAKFDDSHSIMDFLAEQYGLDANNGQIDLATVLQQIGATGGFQATPGGPKVAKFEITVDGHGDDISRIRVQTDDKGKQSFEIVDKGGTVVKTLGSRQALEDELRASYAHAEMKKTETLTVDAKGNTVLADVPTSATKAQVEQSRDRLVSSQAYIDDHRRQEEQRQKEKGGH